MSELATGPALVVPVPCDRLAYLEAAEDLARRYVELSEHGNRVDQAIAAKRELARHLKAGRFAPPRPKNFVAKLATLPRAPAISPEEALRYRASSGERAE